LSNQIVPGSPGPLAAHAPDVAAVRPLYDYGRRDGWMHMPRNFYERAMNTWLFVIGI
jgi:hypothetical protein